MSKHTHAELIKAKADNMELVVFIRRLSSYRWASTNINAIFHNPDADFFLCLPQHEKACLHWLNGGDIQYQDFPTNPWGTLGGNKGNWSWGHDLVFMQEEFHTRIKPKKMKRWIVVGDWVGIDEYVAPRHFATRGECVDYWERNYTSHPQYIEIEIEEI